MAQDIAALGITERFDRCICIVVSEETGTLSLAIRGNLKDQLPAVDYKNFY